MLEDYWYIACRSIKLKRNPLSVTIFNKPLVLFRDQNRQAVALEDRCQHRNAPLSCGKVVNGSVQCPYHGWRYAGDGKLVEIPYSYSLPSHTIPSYPCYEQDGYIWVCQVNPKLD